MWLAPCLAACPALWLGHVPDVVARFVGAGTSTHMTEGCLPTCMHIAQTVIEGFRWYRHRLFAKARFGMLTWAVLRHLFPLACVNYRWQFTNSYPAVKSSEVRCPSHARHACCGTAWSLDIPTASRCNATSCPACV